MDRAHQNRAADAEPRFTEYQLTPAGFRAWADYLEYSQRKGVK